MQFVCWLLHSICLLAVSLPYCYMLYIFRSLLCSNQLFYIFHYSFYVCFLVLYVVLSILYVLCFVLFCVLFLPLYIVVYFLLVYNFTDHCHRVKTQLQLINIISYLLVHVLRFHSIDLSHVTSNCPTFAMFVRCTKKFLAEFHGMYMVIRHLPSPF